MDKWVDTQKLNEELMSDGWLSPDTYCNNFAVITHRPAVYLLSVLNRKNYFSHCLVAYVGMSIDLKKCLSNHEILPLLEGEDLWVERWFLPTKKQDLRAIESKYIRAFNPPWNILGKKRGLDLS